MNQTEYELFLFDEEGSYLFDDPAEGLEIKDVDFVPRIGEILDHWFPNEERDPAFREKVKGVFQVFAVRHPISTIDGEGEHLTSYQYRPFSPNVYAKRISPDFETFLDSTLRFGE
ncbi:hypothetical protein CMI48_00800 [Candidatus Pacearchaeota archaeon]|jgi:hypothetical protein|nr:hypothetical protein [Candidatus Pacearchaeota archaeon]|tara:strand:+ start:152 stop:496 length:345 start_codon:yes stop_codon:yes gene_type:complete